MGYSTIAENAFVYFMSWSVAMHPTWRRVGGGTNVPIQCASENGHRVLHEFVGSSASDLYSTIAENAFVYFMGWSVTMHPTWRRVGGGTMPRSSAHQKMAIVYFMSLS